MTGKTALGLALALALGFGVLERASSIPDAAAWDVWCAGRLGDPIYLETHENLANAWLRARLIKAWSERPGRPAFASCEARPVIERGPNAPFR